MVDHMHAGGAMVDAGADVGGSGQPAVIHCHVATVLNRQSLLYETPLPHLKTQDEIPAFMTCWS